MLQKIRDGSRWIMIIIIGAIAAVFTLYLGSQGGLTAAPDEGIVVRVGPRTFDVRDVDRQRRQLEANLREQLGDSFDANAAADYLEESAASGLLRSALLAYEAERLGLVAGEEEVRDYFRSIPNVVDANGSIRPDVVANVERRYGSKARFQQALRDDLLIQKAQRVIWRSLEVSAAEARASLRYAQEEVDIALVTFDGTKRPEGLEPSEAAVQALLAEQSDRLQKAYDQRRAEFDRPEEVRARHILIRRGDGEEAAAAGRETLEKARGRFEAGESFADLAAELSDDPGSKEKGGDLGFFPRGRMVQAFEDVAFQLAPGTLSEVVESSSGHHLILVEEKRPAQLTPFEEAREQIAHDLALNEATEAAGRERAEAMALRIRAGQSLIDAAREEELSVERPDALRRHPNGFVPGLGIAPEVLLAAFSLPDEGGSDPTVHEAGDRKFVLVQLLERRSPTDEELEVGIEAERARLLKERRASIEQIWLDSLRDELSASGELVYDLTQMR